MRKALILAAAGVAALAACERKPSDAPRTPSPPNSGPTSLQPTALPERAAGLWEQKVTTAGVTQTSQICLDKTVEARFSLWGQQAGENACSETKLTRRADGGFDFASTCDMGPNGQTATQGSITGDFARAYKVSAQSTTTGAAAAQMNGSHAMTLEAAWKGPCPAGMTPGDMLLPGGMKINMLKIPQG